MFIAIEGIDGSGKTTVSEALAGRLGSVLTKEPTFSSEHADELNLKLMDSMDREIEFCVDRIRHQELLKGYLKPLTVQHKFGPPVHRKGVVCVRYIWSGLSYAKVFNPSAFQFIKSLYRHEFFLKPDAYVFIDTPVETCWERRKVQSHEQLLKLRQAYKETEMLISPDSKIITVPGTGEVDQIVKEILTLLK